jgi:succinyl-diaminopimelate desuccinylase
MITTGNHHDFWLLFTEDEEIGAENGVRQVIERLCSNNLAPDVVFIPDGGPDFAYVEKEKGILKFMAHTTGRAAHGSRPFLGDNAVDKMWAFYEDLRQEYPNPINEADWRPSIAMTLINAGQTLNKIPDACDAGFDMRFTEDHELIVVQTEIEIVAANYDAVIDVASFGMATYFPKENPIAERFIDILRRASGKEPDILHSNGASTARVYMEYKPDIVVLMSNPTMGGSHSDSECVLKSSLEPYYQVVLETAQL